MGDPTKLRKKYEVPRKSWEKERIEREKQLMQAYGMRRKKELRRMETVLRNLKRRARVLIGKPDPAAEKLLLAKAHRMGLVPSDASLDTILRLTLENILERRLQTQLFKLGIAKTLKQARQMIVHRHISVDGEKIISPAYIVQREEESKISFAPNSPFVSKSKPAPATPAAPTQEESVKKLQGKEEQSEVATLSKGESTEPADVVG